MKGFLLFDYRSANGREYTTPWSEVGEQLATDQMTPLLKESARRALRVTHGTELAPFKTVEHTIGGKEQVAPLVFRHDTSGLTSDFDDVSVGHDDPFTGFAGAPL